MENKLLKGIRVVDFTWHITGPLTTKPLADCGAEVIVVESKNRPGLQRGGLRTGSGDQFYSGKLAITLNTATPKGLELTKRLIGISDIVVENYAGGAMERMGLGYDVLRKIKPDIIMLSSSMQGQTGPYRSHPGSGHKLTALAGFNQIMGWPDREPGYNGAYTDFIAPRYNIIAVMAALEYRNRTGKGQYLDISQYETGIQFMAPLILDYELNGRVPQRTGNRVPHAAPHNAYRCLGEDRWCTIAVFTDGEWEAFKKVLGNPAWAQQEKFATLLGRKKNEEELDRLVGEWTSSRTAEEVQDTLQAAGVPAGVVETGEDLLDKDRQFKYRGTFTEVEYPGIGSFRTPGMHFVASKFCHDLKGAPLMGQHNDYVFKELLHIPEAEYEELKNEKVIY